MRTTSRIEITWHLQVVPEVAKLGSGGRLAAGQLESSIGAGKRHLVENREAPYSAK